ncbi:MAG: PhnD/SsuA/transferrin family substrate-binding protein [Dakarella massiliensis]
MFVVRSDRKDLKTLADLKGKSVVASQKNDFSGWQVAMGEIAKSGFNWRDFFGEQDFVIYQLPDVVTDVLAGTSDIGILTTCALETLENDGWIEKGALRVINESGSAPERLHLPPEHGPVSGRGFRLSRRREAGPRA